ncbi:hypothetical protein [Sorangium cellulosum]|uniref:hypothetical protein n=1 Tax=Sorangium cellulosum TaxID=56 RepID=UPI000B1E3ACC|nr:hypothetical protein [Sorangium cellulosum]
MPGSPGDCDPTLPGIALWFGGTLTGEAGGLGVAVGELGVVVGAWPTRGPLLPVVALPS